MTPEQQAHPGQVALAAAKAKWDDATAAGVDAYAAARNAFAAACITYDHAYAAACDAYDAEMERINKEYPR